MKFKDWTKETSALLLGLKLCEEAGEVGKEISKAFMGSWPPVNRRLLHDELDHVEYLVKVLREKFPMGA